MRMQSVRQWAIALLIVGLAWSIMVMTHEAGHLVGGWCGGAVVKDYDLRPWRLPYSMFEPDPHPLLTLWAGPLLGVTVPIVLALMIQKRIVAMVASFCLVANGLYLAVGLLTDDRWIDSQRLLEHGSSTWLILIFSQACLVPGYPWLRSSWVGYFRNSPR
ncbi:MAG: hypothetical protein JNM43_29610 [Planctomycetaceae bacterium]|nr:hypothetical protein [Planctomycetaceae bacterium]